MERFRLQTRATIFLRLYRVLEGMLERRYSGRRQGNSVIMQYLSDEDSEPYRAELNLCREIRNILSHCADEDGNPVIEPSEEVLEKLYAVVEHVRRPCPAMECGTPRERILCASINDQILNVMRAMDNRGFSHVPILERERVIGVFSATALFSHLGKRGLRSLDNDSRIGCLKETLRRDRYGAERYLFYPRNATLTQVRAAFEDRIERNHRLSAVFITENGTGDEPLMAMLTHWDVLKEPPEP